MLAARIKTSPPPTVMMPAAFWALVPGALSFLAVRQRVLDDGPAGQRLALAAFGGQVDLCGAPGHRVPVEVGGEAFPCGQGATLGRVRIVEDSANRLRQRCGISWGA